jgi:hypothetical protein
MTLPEGKSSTYFFIYVSLRVLSVAQSITPIGWSLNKRESKLVPVQTINAYAREEV